MDVVAALGIELADLFEKPVGHYAAPSRSRIPARDVLTAVAHELDVAAVLLADVAEVRTVTEEQWQRIATAAARIGAARMHVHD